jgi:hypothetical protein
VRWQSRSRLRDEPPSKKRAQVADALGEERARAHVVASTGVHVARPLQSLGRAQVFRHTGGSSGACLVHTSPAPHDAGSFQRQ